MEALSEAASRAERWARGLRGQRRPAARGASLFLSATEAKRWQAEELQWLRALRRPAKQEDMRHG